MPPSLLIAADLFPATLRLGGTRVSVFGLFAAFGLMAALGLSQYTARLAGLNAQQLWDVGLFAIVAALVISRLLLIADDPRGFLRFPLLLLSLPSLTWPGMALTGAATLIYLRLKRMPLAATLDALSPSAATLAGVLALTHFLEGTWPGMPSALPWALHGRQPVQLYALAAAAALGADALRRLHPPHAHGAVAARLLLSGGVTAFLLDMLAQPAAGAELLDPGQYAALGCVAAGSFWFARQRRLTPHTKTPQETA